MLCTRGRGTTNSIIKTYVFCSIAILDSNYSAALPMFDSLVFEGDQEYPLIENGKIVDRVILFGDIYQEGGCIFLNPKGSFPQC